MKLPKTQKGITHILLLVAALGLIIFLLFSSSAPFKDKLFSSLFPKPSSKATTLPIVFKSQSGADLQANPDGIPTTTSVSIKIELTSTLGPPQSASGSATYTQSYKVAESSADLDNASFLPYNSAPVVVDYTFKDTKLGSKNIFVDFKDTTDKVDRKSARINLISDTKIDTLSYFISKHPDKGLTFSHPLSQLVDGQTVTMLNGMQKLMRFIPGIILIYI